MTAILMALIAFNMFNIALGKETNQGIIHDMSHLSICYNFSVGNPDKMEFYSPNYPTKYPNSTTCTLKLTAPFGSYIRVEFRDRFDVENSAECRYDYVEARDGPYGYSPVIKKMCGHWFPQPIHSRDRFLWMRFHSDADLEYAGFRGVYEFVPFKDMTRPQNEECSMTIGGPQGLIEFKDIPQENILYSRRWKVALDCTWRIRVDPEKNLYVRFEKFEIFEVNNCDVNYFEVYEEGKDGEEKLKSQFCGTAAQPLRIETNLANIRLFAEHAALWRDQPNFTILYTAFRPSTECDKELEYDCNDGTCIDIRLKCNQHDNCNYKYDEEPETCFEEAGGYSDHMVIILIIFFVLVVGMGVSIGLSCAHKLRQRREREREYKERRSKEASLETAADHRIAPSRSALELQATLAAQAAQEAVRRHSLRLAEVEDKNEAPKPNGGTEQTRTKPPIPPPPNSKPLPNPKPPGILLRGPPPYGWNLPPTEAGSSQPRLDTRRHSTPSRPGSQVIADR